MVDAVHTDEAWLDRFDVWLASNGIDTIGLSDAQIADLQKQFADSQGFSDRGESAANTSGAQTVATDSPAAKRSMPWLLIVLIAGGCLIVLVFGLHLGGGRRYSPPQDVAPADTQPVEAAPSTSPPSVPPKPRKVTPKPEGFR